MLNRIARVLGLVLVGWIMSCESVEDEDPPQGDITQDDQEGIDNLVTQVSDLDVPNDEEVSEPVKDFVDLEGGSEAEEALDADGDGYDAATDCDDGQVNVHPGRLEQCANGVDDDCDVSVDEVGCTAHVDQDGDLYSIDSGWDCDDNTVELNHGAPEACANGIDENCNGSVDEAACVADADGDGFGSHFIWDCNDADPSVHAYAAEIPANGVDEDCDGSQTM